MVCLSECALRAPRVSTLMLAVAIALCLSLPQAAEAQYYVLDGFGGVHAGGGAPVISPPTAYFGFDIAKDIAYVASTGNSVLVLDGFGGVHRGGPVIPVAPASPYFGFNIARAIAHRTIPPRLNFTSTSTSNIEVTSATNVIAVSTTLTLPDDGFVLILGSLGLGSNHLTEVAFASVCFGVDGTVCRDSIDRQAEARGVLAGGGFNIVSLSQGTFLSAGAHTFNVLIRKLGGIDDGMVEYYDPTIVAVLIDQNRVGGS